MKIQYFLILIISLFCCKKNDKELPISNNYLVKKSPNDTILVQKYPDNKLEYLIISKDSLNSSELQISYYENGAIKEKGLQGIISNRDLNTKSSIETWFYYDKLKQLDSTIYYNNDEFGKDYIEKKRFSKNGKLDAVEHYNNYILYENEIDTLGTWQKYSDKGQLIKTDNFKRKSK